MAQRSNWDCTSVALTGAVEYLAWARSQTVVELSSECLHWRTKRLFQNNDPRITTYRGLRVLRQEGVCSLEQWPHGNSDELKSLRPGERLRNILADAARYRIGGFLRLRHEIPGLKRWLDARIPIVFSMFLHDPSYFDWQSREDSITLPMPGAKDERAVKHTVLAVGYDKGGRFLIRASEGPRWKMKGHFWMPLDFILSPENATEFYVITELAAPRPS